MIITNKTDMDLMKPQKTIAIHAVQNDQNSRKLEISLLSNGNPWEIPEQAAVLIRYKKPDGKEGEYDTLSDGTQAWKITGNNLEIALVPQILTTAGPVSMTVTLICEEITLSTFMFFIHVHPAIQVNENESSNYYFSTRFLHAPASAKAGQFLRVLSVDEKGRITGIETAEAPSDTPAIVCSTQGTDFFLTDAAEQHLKGLRVFGKTNQTGIPSSGVPAALNCPGQNGCIRVYVSGKNLFNPALLAMVEGYNTYDEATGLWTTSSASGWSKSIFYNITGSASARDISKLVKLPGGMDITIKLHDFVNNTGVSPAASYALFRNDGTLVESFTANDVITIQTPDEECWLDIRRFSNSGALSFRAIQIEAGSTATSFVPFDSQTITAATPNGLPGLPVDSGGNYTDSAGQQWICDEIDFAQGVYIRRILNQTLTGAEAWSNPDAASNITVRCALDGLPEITGAASSQKANVKCSHFSAVTADNTKNGTTGISVNTDGTQIHFACGEETADTDTWKTYLAQQYAANTPVVLQAILKEPVETTLEADAMAEYAAVYTYKIITALSNDAGTAMLAAYVADTKTYIDNKFAALSAAIVNNT